MKRKVYNSVDVKVGSFIRGWVLATYHTDIIKIDKYSNLWGMVKQSLELLPADYRMLEDRSEYISIVLLRDSSKTKAYDIEKDRAYRVNTLYRCYISEEGSNKLRRYLEKQFKAAFHTYMVGAVGNNPEMTILEGITQFLLDYNLEGAIDNKMLGRLQKDWYRYRQANQDKYAIPIFF
jgi:hypothetical protein